MRFFATHDAHEGRQLDGGKELLKKRNPVERVSKIAYVELLERHVKLEAAQFLGNLIETVLANNGVQISFIST